MHVFGNGSIKRIERLCGCECDVDLEPGISLSGVAQAQGARVSVVPPGAVK